MMDRKFSDTFAQLLMIGNTWFKIVTHKYCVGYRYVNN